MNIVPINKKYTYTIFEQNLNLLSKTFSFLDIKSIGYSVMGKNLYVIKLGNGSNNVFYSSSIHANEWISSIILMKFVEDYCNAYVNNNYLYGYSIQKLFKTSSIYIMPMINPDGVDLVTGNIPLNNPYYLNTRFIANNFPNIDFPNGWKSNINGKNLINFHH